MRADNISAMFKLIREGAMTNKEADEWFRQQDKLQRCFFEAFDPKSMKSQVPADDKSATEVSSSDNLSVKENHIEEVSGEKILAQEAPVQDNSAQEVPMDETLVQGDSTQETLVPDTTIQDVPTQQSPIQQPIIRKTPIKETPIEQQHSLQQTPARHGHFQQSPTRQYPSQQTPIRQAPFQRPPEHYLPPQHCFHNINFLRDQILAQIRSEIWFEIREMRAGFFNMGAEISDTKYQMMRMKSEIEAEIAKIHVPYSNVRLIALEERIKELMTKMENINDTHDKFLKIIDKQQDEGEYDLLNLYHFVPDRVKGFYIVNVQFKDGSTKMFDLRSIVVKSDSFKRSLGMDAGCELFRYMLRRIYEGHVGDYAISENSRRGHFFIGKQVLDRMFELIFDGYGLDINRRNIISERLETALIKSGTQVCSNDRRRSRPLDDNQINES